MNIPDEAVEAAIKALLNMDDSALSVTEPAYIEYLSGQVRKSLAAAAPHLMAEAWDEGVNDGTWNAEHHFQIANGTRQEIENPYRSAA